MKSVTIDECTEGYILKEGGTDNVYAVTKDGLIRKVKELLGITDKKLKKPLIKKILEKKYILGTNKRVDALIEEMKQIAGQRAAGAIPEQSRPRFSEIVTELNTVHGFSQKHLADMIETKKINDDLKNNKVKIVVNKFPCEKFDTTNLIAKIAGKSTYWVSGQKVCIQREGYAEGLRVYITVADLRYLYEHPDEIKNVSKTRRYHITGFLKDVDDVSTLSGSEQAAEIKEPEQEQESEPEEPEEQSESKEQEKEPEEPEPEKQKPLTQAFQEDMGFDYRAVQPKWVGKLQVYSNINGKIVIKEDKAILLTTNKMIETLLPLGETDLNRCIRGITHEKQKILRNYLTALRARHG